MSGLDLDQHYNFHVSSSPIPSELERFCDKVERLLQRYGEMTHDMRALQAQVTALQQERDQLTQRVHEARERIDALLEQWPDAAVPVEQQP